ncbi:MAG: SDR family oxidoreductase [Saprospiraceae bacterium]
MNVKGKVAIVTGSSKGIGLATVTSLLAQGVKVAGWSRSGTDLDHPNFKSIKADVTNVEAVQEAYDQTVNAFGEDVSMLINNAGLGYFAPIEEIKLEDWHQMINTNINGIFYVTRLVVPRMKAMEEGHIINISSIAGTTGMPNLSAYCATKFAVRGMSQSLYKELRNDGIKVSCIYPGSVQTNFFDDIESVEANENMMQPNDIAETILHCLSSSANYHHVDIEVRPLRPKGKQ